MDLLVQARETAIEDLVRLKHTYENHTFSARDVIIFDLEFPDGSDQGDWLAYVKKAAMRIEQFRSHALRQNPNPQKARKEGAREDDRPLRSDNEQAWLQAEDQLSKKGHKKHSGKQQVKKGKKPRKRSKKGPSGKGEGHKPRASGGEPITVAPTISRSRAVPGIVPFGRFGASQPPRAGASRLPAFPAFPGNARH